MRFFRKYILFPVLQFIINFLEFQSYREGYTNNHPSNLFPVSYYESFDFIGERGFSYFSNSINYYSYRLRTFYFFRKLYRFALYKFLVGFNENFSSDIEETRFFFYFKKGLSQISGTESTGDELADFTFFTVRHLFFSGLRHLWGLIIISLVNSLSLLVEKAVYFVFQHSFFTFILILLFIFFFYRLSPIPKIYRSVVRYISAKSIFRFRNFFWRRIAYIFSRARSLFVDDKEIVFERRLKESLEEYVERVNYRFNPSPVSIVFTRILRGLHSLIVGLFKLLSETTGFRALDAVASGDKRQDIAPDRSNREVIRMLKDHLFSGLLRNLHRFRIFLISFFRKKLSLLSRFLFKLIFSPFYLIQSTVRFFWSLFLRFFAGAKDSSFILTSKISGTKYLLYFRYFLRYITNDKSYFLVRLKQRLTFSRLFSLIRFLNSRLSIVNSIIIVTALNVKVSLKRMQGKLSLILCRIRFRTRYYIEKFKSIFYD